MQIPVKKIIGDIDKRWKAAKITRFGISLPEYLALFTREIRRDDIDDIAKSMAFSFILAIFPGIIFLFTLIPYMPIPKLGDNIMMYLADLLPGNVFQFVKATIQDIVHRQNSGLLSLGFVLALYSATNGSLAMINAFNKCYKIKEKRGFIKTRLIAVFMTFVLTFVLFVSVAILIESEVILDYLLALGFLKDVYIYYLIKAMNYLVIIFTFYLSISFIYHFAPSNEIRTGFFSIGSAGATFLCIAATAVFGLYINHFSTYNKVYGSIGTIIVFMLWMYIISWVILVGFELNASLYQMKQLSKEKEH